MSDQTRVVYPQVIKYHTIATTHPSKLRRDYPVMRAIMKEKIRLYNHDTHNFLPEQLICTEVFDVPDCSIKELGWNSSWSFNNMFLRELQSNQCTPINIKMYDKTEMWQPRDLEEFLSYCCKGEPLLQGYHLDRKRTGTNTPSQSACLANTHHTRVLLSETDENVKEPTPELTVDTTEIDLTMYVRTKAFARSRDRLQWRTATSSLQLVNGKVISQGNITWELADYDQLRKCCDLQPLPNTTQEEYKLARMYNCTFSVSDWRMCLWTKCMVDGRECWLDLRSARDLIREDVRRCDNAPRKNLFPKQGVSIVDQTDLRRPIAIPRWPLHKLPEELRRVQYPNLARRLEEYFAMVNPYTKQQIIPQDFRLAALVMMKGAVLDFDVDMAGSCHWFWPIMGKVVILYYPLNEWTLMWYSVNKWENKRRCFIDSYLRHSPKKLLLRPDSLTILPPCIIAFCASEDSIVLRGNFYSGVELPLLNMCAEVSEVHRLGQPKLLYQRAFEACKTLCEVYYERRKKNARFSKVEIEGFCSLAKHHILDNKKMHEYITTYGDKAAALLNQDLTKIRSLCVYLQDKAVMTSQSGLSIISGRTKILVPPCDPDSRLKDDCSKLQKLKNCSMCGRRKAKLSHTYNFGPMCSSCQETYVKPGLAANLEQSKQGKNPKLSAASVPQQVTPRVNSSKSVNQGAGRSRILPEVGREKTPVLPIQRALHVEPGPNQTPDLHNQGCDAFENLNSSIYNLHQSIENYLTVKKPTTVVRITYGDKGDEQVTIVKTKPQDKVQIMDVQECEKGRKTTRWGPVTNRC